MRKFFFNDESGATLVEYGVALILAIIVGGLALTQLATQTTENLDSTCDIMAPTAAVAAGVVDTCT